ncbi:tripartite motif-containing protein 16-like [Xyrauchen texanus]|uniref:tripartite motif-containing protein 16-like n=1 Tax=Xyrauchen texanus TaxID=154827 RepID=UPI0022429BC8|nr:tripartite motif-containing protein 16-like [Xyrauchen texanus]
MAHAVNDQSLNYLSCPVCLELLKDPVTIPCGHSYCMSCIKNCWDQENSQKKPCSCPQCREEFSCRPAVKKCTALADAVSNMKTHAHTRMSLDSTAVLDEYCDFCTPGKQKAVQTCLTCLASYCETHVKDHYEFRALHRHTLVRPSSHLQQKICKSHNKLLEVYCVDDKCCLCMLCMMDSHSGHQTTSAVNAWRTQKMICMVFSPCLELNMKSDTVTLGIFKDRKYAICPVDAPTCHTRTLPEEIAGVNSAQAVVDYNDKFVITITEAFGDMLSKVNELVRRQEKTELRRATDLQKHVELKLAAMKKRDAELNELGSTDDHIYFLQKFQSLSSSEFASSGFVKDDSSFALLGVESTLSEQKKQLEEVFQKNIQMFSETAKKVKIVLPAEPKLRVDFREYARKLKLHTDSAHHCLKLLQDNQKAERGDWDVSSRADHPERFTYWCQILCVERVEGRSYWEADWSGTAVHFAVSYSSIFRKSIGNYGRFGYNWQSWCLACSKYVCHFIHNGIKTSITPPQSAKIGVYLDEKAGTLSFYSVLQNDTMMLLHRVHDLFIAPLYAGFTLEGHSSVTLCS